MSVTYIVDQRDAQGRVVALPAYTTMIGDSTDTKPIVDSVGSALKVGSEFWERDTNNRWVWDGLTWKQSASQETRAIWALDHSLRVQNQEIARVLLSMHNGMSLSGLIETEPIEFSR